MGFWLDVRHALRRLRKNPGFTLVAIGTLALGIGVNAGVYAYVDALAFRPLPVRDADRVVALYGALEDGTLRDFSYPDFPDYRDGAGDVFAAMAGFSPGPVSVRTDAAAVMAWREMVTPGYFDVLRPRLEMGRVLRDDDVRAVVISHGFWQRYFGGNTGVIDRVIELNGHSFTIVGVTGARFTGSRLFSFAPELWIPIAAHREIAPGSDNWLVSRDGGWLSLIGRLRPGVSLAQASAAAASVAQALAQTYPATHEGRAVRLYSNERAINLWAFDPAQLQRAGYATMLGVALVLLIACANVANLQLARATSRRRELAVRMSLGAGRARVVRSMVTESLLLSLIGGLAGIGVAYWFLDISAAFVPALDFATAFEPAIDWRVLAFTSIIAILAGLLAGVAPALRAGRADPASTLRSESGGAGKRARLLDALVVGQVAFSLMALVGAGLFVKSLDNTRRIDPGFPLQNGLVLSADPALHGYDAAQAERFYRDLLERIRALPGVISVTRASNIPLNGNSESARVGVAGTTATEQDRIAAWSYTVAPGYFTTLGSPVIEGREFTVSDDTSAARVVVLNHTLASRLWPDASAIGRRVQVGSSNATVIGVVADTKLGMRNEQTRSMIAFSLLQQPDTRLTVLIRTAGDPAALAPEVRDRAAALDPTIALIGLRTLEANTQYTLSAAEGGARGGGLFGALALLLTTAGLYGVVSYGVARRNREIGIRLALGAHQGGVVRLVVSQGMKLTLLGIAIGSIGTLGAGRVLASLLYDVHPADIASFGIAIAILSTIALIASWLPARRATRIDPLRVLREE